MTFKRVLLVRMDRIGDLILTLPIDQSPALAGAEAHWLITRGLSPYAEFAVPKRKFTEFPREFSLRRFFQLVHLLVKNHFDAAIVFHAPWWVNLALFAAQIPVRVGSKGQWHSILFLNRTFRQKRSEARHHEFEYNRLLVAEGLRNGKDGVRPAPLRLNSTSSGALKSNGLTAGAYFVVHPGMGGSARNWPVENYIEWIRRVSSEAPVVVTGTAGDAEWLEPIKRACGSIPTVRWLDGQLSTAEWLTVLQNARAVLAPSTGAIHAAASLGVPSVGIYSPVKVQAPTRWGPLGPFAKALVPEVECPGHFECLGEKCPHYDCMTRIGPEQVINEMRRLVGLKGEK